MNNSADLISVIVPVYNVERYLKQCVDSILRQTYKNLELILVDDGSTDSSGQICDECRSLYMRCSVLHKINDGLGMARNTGIEVMRGKYVMFVDSDDWIKPDYIERLYEVIVQTGVDYCKGGYERFIDNGRIVGKLHLNNEFFPGTKAKTSLLPRMVGAEPTKHDCIEGSVCGALYNTAVITANKLTFPSEREYISEDMAFNLQYMQYANGACLIPYEGYMYRYNRNSLTTCYKKNRLESCVYFYYEMRKKLIDYGYDELTILRLKRMFFVNVRTCIVQEKKHISGKRFFDSLDSIRNICDNDTVREVIYNYPVERLGTKQLLFLKLIVRKKAITLKMLVEMGVLSS